MTEKSKLIKHAYNTYKIAPISSWILGLVTGLLIAALLAVDLAVPMVSVVVVPLLVLPIIFSSTLQHLIFKTNGQLTVTTSFRGFGLYFTRLYRSSFRYFLSLLKAIAVFFIFETVISFITSTVMQLTSPEFGEAINDLYNILYSEEGTMTDAYNALLSHGGILFNYVAIIIIPALYLGVLFFIYNVSRYSLMIYFQLDHQNINPRFTKFVYSDLLRRYRMRIFKDYWMLNWPLYVLLAVGFGVGAFIGYLWQHDIMAMISTGYVLGMLLASFFMPFYFCNQEAMFDKYADDINGSAKNVTSLMLTNIQRSIDLSNEEKERLGKSLGATGLTTEDEQNDNKKGPDGP